MAKPKPEGKKRAPRKAKKPKSEGPKKPKSGFMYFSQERRKTLKEEQPDLKITEASKIIGKEWNELDMQEKGPYNELASQDKQRYLKEKEAAAPSEPKNAKKPKKAPAPKKQEDDDDDDESEVDQGEEEEADDIESD